MRVALALIMAAGIVVSAVSQAAIYRWVDEQGQVHYTETPPPAGNQDRGTRVRTLGPPTGAVEQGRQRSQAIQEQLKSIEKARAEANEKQARQAEDSARREANCEAAKSNLAKLEVRTNRRFQDSDGNVTMMTEEERLRKMEEAREQIEKNCN